MCFDYDGCCEVWNESTPKARKPYKCVECFRVIQPGQRYRKVFWVYKGDASTERTCMACEAVRGIIEQYERDEGCTGNEAVCPIGALAEEISQHNDGYGLLHRDSENDRDFVEPEAAHLFKHAQLAFCV